MSRFLLKLASIILFLCYNESTKMDKKGETMWTIMGLPTGVKRARDFVGSQFNWRDNLGLVATVSPLTFLAPEFVNALVSGHDDRRMLASTQIFAGVENALVQFIAGIKAAEFTAHAASLVNIDPTIAGLLGFIVAAGGLRVFNNIAQNSTHELASLVPSGRLKDQVEAISTLAPTIPVLALELLI